MSRHDWYRNTGWDPAIAADFDARIARTRKPWSKWQYFNIQASMLATRGLLDEALALHRRTLVEVAAIEASWRRTTLGAIACILEQQGLTAEAGAAAREAIAACSLKDASMRTEPDQEPEAVVKRLAAQRRARGAATKKRIKNRGRRGS